MYLRAGILAAGRLVHGLHPDKAGLLFAPLTYSGPLAFSGLILKREPNESILLLFQEIF